MNCNFYESATLTWSKVEIYQPLRVETSALVVFVYRSFTSCCPNEQTPNYQTCSKHIDCHSCNKCAIRNKLLLRAASTGSLINKILYIDNLEQNRTLSMHKISIKTGIMSNHLKQLNGCSFSMCEKFQKFPLFQKHLVLTNWIAQRCSSIIPLVPWPGFDRMRNWNASYIKRLWPFKWNSSSLSTPQPLIEWTW